MLGLQRFLKFVVDWGLLGVVYILYVHYVISLVYYCKIFTDLIKKTIYYVDCTLYKTTVSNNSGEKMIKCFNKK